MPLSPWSSTVAWAAVAAWLRARGVALGDRVAILAENRPEWAIADFAALMTGAVVVRIRDSDRRAMRHISAGFGDPGSFSSHNEAQLHRFSSRGSPRRASSTSC